MKRRGIYLEKLRLDELKEPLVFDFGDERESAPGLTPLRPVLERPLERLEGRVIVTQVTLANKSKHRVLLSNLSAQDPALNEHFLAVSFQRDGQWFHLARYFDPDYASRGPSALATFLKLKLHEVFPIRYDVSGIAIGKQSALSGSIAERPKKKLSRGEIMALALPELPPEWR